LREPFPCIQPRIRGVDDGGALKIKNKLIWIRTRKRELHHEDHEDKKQVFFEEQL